MAHVSFPSRLSCPPPTRMRVLRQGKERDKTSRLSPASKRSIPLKTRHPPECGTDKSAGDTTEKVKKNKEERTRKLRSRMNTLELAGAVDDAQMTEPKAKRKKRGGRIDTNVKGLTKASARDPLSCWFLRSLASKQQIPRAEISSCLYTKTLGH